MKLLHVFFIGLAAVQARPDKKDSGGCSSNDQCPQEYACVNQQCVDPCSVTPGGHNSLCQSCYHEPILSCAPGYEDRKISCTSNSECPGDLACIKEKCVDPCINKCGANTQCRVYGKKPLCQCLPRFTGCALTGCLPIPEGRERGECQNHDDCPDNRACNAAFQCVNPCNRYCGANMECHATGHRPECSCAQGFQGHPDTGCKRPPPPASTCSGNNDCLAHLACVRRKCLNPCEGACGANARCEVRDHRPFCTCDPGYTGCALSGCFPEIVLPPPRCMTSEECGEKQACINGDCVDPCIKRECGANTQCKVSGHLASCISTVTVTPRPPLPLSVTAWPTPDCTVECSGDDQCPPGRACVDHHCADPCPGFCGANSTCRVVNHVPSCACMPGHTGDPFQGCSRQPGFGCGQSWPPVPVGVKKFKAEVTKKNWLEAVLQCMKDGQRLATVMNRQELDDAKEAIRNTNIRGGNFWISGTDHLHNKEWFWFTTNERIGELRDWGNNQPDSNGDDCLEFWEADQQIGYKWNDRPCHEQHNYICEYYQ